MCWYAGLPNSVKYRIVTAITLFKVTDFGTNRKLIYDFLLVINTNLLLSYTVSKLRVIIGQILASESKVSHFNALAAWSPANLTINDISPKTRFFGLHFRCNILTGCQWVAKVPNGVIASLTNCILVLLPLITNYFYKQIPL